MLSWERFVGLRYLMAKRRRSVLSIITMISVTGVALGVTALIVVLSVMGGFKKDLKEKIIGTKAHIVIQAHDEEPLRDSDSLTEKVMGVQGVIGASPFVEAEVMVSSPTNLSGVILRGIDPDRIGSVSKVKLNTEKGKFEYLVDDAPLMDELEREKDHELDALLKKVRTEREEREAETKNGALVNLPDGGTLPETELPSDMPADETSDRYGEEGFMPSIFEDSPVDEDGEMPPLFDEEEAPTRLPGLVIGRELARSLQVKLGQEVNVVTPNGEIGPMGPIPKSRPFRIVGIFYSGMYEYDANYAYTSLIDSHAFLGIDGATGIELKTEDVDLAPIVAERIQKLLGPAVNVLDWQELNRSLFYALKLEKIAMFVVLTFIILVASFSIVAMLIMIVIEKGREIAILKAIGATNGGIMRTFIFQGTVIGTLGALIGLVLGLAICYFLAEFGFPLNSEVYYISTLPVDVDPAEVLMVVIAAIGISLMATIYPSIQAARLNPVDGLRDE